MKEAALITLAIIPIAYAIYRIVQAGVWVEYIINDGRERPND